VECHCLVCYPQYSLLYCWLPVNGGGVEYVEYQGVESSSNITSDLSKHIHAGRRRALPLYTFLPQKQSPLLLGSQVPILCMSLAQSSCSFALQRIGYLAHLCQIRQQRYPSLSCPCQYYRHLGLGIIALN